MVEAIGLLDEQFGIGCFEDDDYCLRAIQAGYRAVIAGDAFVHHFGGRTFVGSGVDFGALMRENERRFREKWAGSGRRAGDLRSRPGRGRETLAQRGGGRGRRPAHGQRRLAGRAGVHVPRPSGRPSIGAGGGLRLGRRRIGRGSRSA